MRALRVRLALLRAAFFGAALRVLFRDAPFRVAFLAVFLAAAFLVAFRVDFPAVLADFRLDFFGVVLALLAPEDLRPVVAVRSRLGRSSRAVLGAGAGGSAGEVVGVGAGEGPGGYSIGRGSIQPDPDQPISI